MSEAVFLSAGVPDAKRGPEFARTADTVAITAAVSALVHVTLGRRLLVWGGHPAITPMVWVVAQSLGVDYGSWVLLYQSRHFADEFPEDNVQFRNVTFTEDVHGDRKLSLRAMRERMFTDHEYQSAVFIGGMAGIVEEFELFRASQPNAAVVPVLSTGGATQMLQDRLGTVAPDLAADLDYVALFHRHLGISPREKRYAHPDDQPDRVEQRFWSPSDTGA